MATKVKVPPERKPRRTKVSSKNQVTLPVAVMAEANVKSGDLIEVDILEDGVLRLRRVRDPWWDAFEQLRGSAPGLSDVADLDRLRDEWER